jgi:hypothetical protein
MFRDSGDRERLASKIAVITSEVLKNTKKDAQNGKFRLSWDIKEI